VRFVGNNAAMRRSLHRCPRAHRRSIGGTLGRPRTSIAALLPPARTRGSGRADRGCLQLRTSKIATDELRSNDTREGRALGRRPHRRDTRLDREYARSAVHLPGARLRERLSSRTRRSCASGLPSRCAAGPRRRCCGAQPEVPSSGLSVAVLSVIAVVRVPVPRREVQPSGRVPHGTVTAGNECRARIDRPRPPHHQPGHDVPWRAHRHRHNTSRARRPVLCLIARSKRRVRRHTCRSALATTTNIGQSVRVGISTSDASGKREAPQARPIS
jgi:hypothetical protein